MTFLICMVILKYSREMRKDLGSKEGRQYSGWNTDHAGDEGGDDSDAAAEGSDGGG